jgi:pimeloyl-ACP methyl ester carboxylesterase
VKRGRDFAARRNHDLLTHDDHPRDPLASISAPTLVIHGTADPMFPLEHGQAMGDEIPGARLLPLEDAGHGVDRADWQVIVDAILDHTDARHAAV